MKRLLYLPFLALIISCETADINTSGTTSTSFYNSNGSYDGTPGTGVGERYNDFEENAFVNVSEEPVSTFSIDADGGSYANMRRFLRSNTLPPKEAIRTEEFINYFELNYEDNSENAPISLNGEISECPWQQGNKLIRIGIKGKTIPKEALPHSNIVLLIDVSGSMSDPDKLDLLKKGFNLLVDEFTGKDKIAIVTYAGSAGIVLPSTSGNEKQKIKSAINSLGSGGGTAGAQGIISAYEIAQQNFIEGGNNRIILGTDGDFNVGISSQEELISLIEEKRKSGIFLTTLGVGQGNLNEGMLEQLANKGNGNFEYIDNLEQAKKVFIYEFSKFYTVAKDVKVQVEFNPALVIAYRLIGYENRKLENDEFEDDKKDAGEIGAGQTITALYEIKPKTNAVARVNPTFTIKFRYKQPDSDISNPLDLDIFDTGNDFLSASENMRFGAAVSGFGMLLRSSAYKGTLTYDDILNWTKNTTSFDPHNFRKEFRELVTKAKGL